jgi:hypothetical protein
MTLIKARVGFFDQPDCCPVKSKHYLCLGGRIEKLEMKKDKKLLFIVNRGSSWVKLI